MQVRCTRFTYKEDARFKSANNKAVPGRDSGRKLHAACALSKKTETWFIDAKRQPAINPLDTCYSQEENSFHTKPHSVQYNSARLQITPQILCTRSRTYHRPTKVTLK